MKNAILITTKICALAVIACALGTASAAVDKDANNAAASAVREALRALGSNPDPTTIRNTVTQEVQKAYAQLAANHPNDEEAHTAMAKAIMQGAGAGLFSIVTRDHAVWSGRGVDGSSAAMHAVINGGAQGSMAGDHKNMVYSHAYGKAAGFASSFLHTGRAVDRNAFITANAHMLTNAFRDAGAPPTGVFRGQETTLERVITDALTNTLAVPGTEAPMSSDTYVNTAGERTPYPTPFPVTDILGQ